jgi:hypothetical protein
MLFSAVPLFLHMPQDGVAACGMLYIDSAKVNSTFSVTTIRTPECIEQRTQLASGGRHSCLRCPVISEETEYDVLLVAEAARAASTPVHITVRPEQAIAAASAFPALCAEHLSAVAKCLITTAGCLQP